MGVKEGKTLHKEYVPLCVRTSFRWHEHCCTCREETKRSPHDCWPLGSSGHGVYFSPEAGTAPDQQFRGHSQAFVVDLLSLCPQLRGETIFGIVTGKRICIKIIRSPFCPFNPNTPRHSKKNACAPIFIFKIFNTLTLISSFSSPLSFQSNFCLWWLLIQENTPKCNPVLLSTVSLCPPANMSFIPSQTEHGVCPLSWCSYHSQLLSTRRIMAFRPQCIVAGLEVSDHCPTLSPNLNQIVLPVR